MQNAPMPEANIVTFDNLLFSLVWDDLPQSYSSWKFEFESRRWPILYALVTKSFEVLAFNLHVRAHVKIPNKSTARDTNARHFLRICGCCWFQQDGATVHTTIRARGWLKSRFGRSHQPPDQAPVAGQESGPVPLDLVLERGHNRAKKDPPPPPPRWLSWKKPSSPSLGQWTKKSNWRYRYPQTSSRLSGA